MKGRKALARTNEDPRIAELRQMSADDFAISVVRDLMVLPRDERNRAVRMVQTFNDAIDREIGSATAR